MSHPLLETMARRPLLGDGAMGTLLAERGGCLDVPCEVLNLTDPERVQQAHLDYILAGAEVIQTNTFGANRYKLAACGRREQVWAVNVAGAKLARAAREVSGEPVFVLGSVGPLGRRLTPLGPLCPEQASAAFREQMEALLAGGVDGFIVETVSDLEELVLAVRAARSLCRLPVVAQVTLSEEGTTLFGAGPREVAAAVAALGADAPDVIGINCGTGPTHVLAALRELAAVLGPGRPLSAQPNAGKPALVDGRCHYPATPAYFAEMVPGLVAAGARLVGGCCGTTPAHVAAMRRALDAVASGETPAGEAVAGPAATVATAGPATASSTPAEAIPAATAEEPAVHVLAGTRPDAGRAGPTPFAARLGRAFVISAELDPPRGVVVRKFTLAATALAEAGVDAINVADSPMARVRMSSLVAAHLVQEASGLDTILHFTTRDRNLMGIQADLLGAHALGIRNILALTGDPPSLGDYARATAVYDVDSIGLVRILRRLNEGVDVAGRSIGRPTEFVVGVGVNPAAEDLELELQRFRHKLDAGVDFVMTQPLYDLETLERFLDRIRPCRTPILLGVMPVHSYQHAEYLHNEVPGISIPPAVRERVREAGDAAEEEGLRIAAELVRGARSAVAGVYLIGSFGRTDALCRLVREIRSWDAAGREQGQGEAVG
ncbi:MAG: bifunctional homocysteine S-methyltransferase/methylenetetrahydrofolate reductase [Clostridia bacterium]|nr:bifunctional homocysteine S-methyltransferase/methylenetetrahydrofolate reductase [Clostridia bacterium]